MASRTINDLYNFYQYICRKQRGIFVTIPQFQQNLDNGQMDELSEKYALYGVSNEIHDSIRPFRIYQPFTSGTDGVVIFPGNYLHQLGNIFTVYGSTVTQVNYISEDEFPFALTVQLRPVSLSAPIAIDTATGFSLYPQSTQTGYYWYIRRPAQPVLAITQVGRVVTYNSAGSTQLEWNEIYWNNIIAKALRYAGINMSEQEISVFAEQYNAETK